MRLIAGMKGEVPTTTLAILITQPKHYSVAFDDRAGKLHSDNVRLIAGMKGETPGITVAMLVSQPKPYSVAFDDKAGKLHSDNVRLIAGIKGEVPWHHCGHVGFPAQTL